MHNKENYVPWSSRLLRDGENLDKIKEKGDQCILKASDYDNPDPVPQRQDVYSSADADAPSQKKLDLLFGPLYDEFFNAGTTPSMKIPSTSAPSTHTNVHAEENNNDQAEEGEQLQNDKFTNPFCAPTQDVAESFSHNIGLEIHQSLSGIFINQAKYTLEILHKHGIDKGQSISTPIATKPKLDADLSVNPIDQTNYRSKIGSLMYLTSSRPDIVQAGSSFELIAFLDADHAGCIDSRKSTSGGIKFLGDKLVSWMSKKQNYTAMSLAEAKYMALSASCAQVIWMRTQLHDYSFNYNKIPLYCDSQTEYQLADMFTKALPEDRFKYLVRLDGSTGELIVSYQSRVSGESPNVLSRIATKLGMLMMLDSYMIDMCLEAWGRSSYDKAMIETDAQKEMVDTLVVAVP
nr:hypothetical protein [Tanacetum cinerariifolium]